MEKVRCGRSIDYVKPIKVATRINYAALPLGNNRITNSLFEQIAVSSPKLDYTYMTSILEH